MLKCRAMWLGKLLIITYTRGDRTGGLQLLQCGLSLWVGFSADMWIRKRDKVEAADSATGTVPPLVT